jgi:hypothetical protein
MFGNDMMRWLEEIGSELNGQHRRCARAEEMYVFCAFGGVRAGIAIARCTIVRQSSNKSRFANCRADTTYYSSSLVPRFPSLLFVDTTVPIANSLVVIGTICSLLTQR